MLSKLSATEIAGLNVPVPVQIGGSMTKPNVNVNLQGAITNLTNQIVAIQTAKLKDKGQDAINNAVNNALGGKNPLTGIKDVISGNKESTSGSGNPITGNKPIDSTSIKRAKDSILQAAKKKAADDAKKAAANALNNMFKKKN
ncbi:MAG: hypothetical protein NWQ09_01940 [Nonlabens sp.]|nr:hypothetical protein [Nonlabens sp.]